MRIYLSYKQTGVPENILINELKDLKTILENNGENDVFIYLFEKDINLLQNQLLRIFKKEIEKSDLIIAYVNYPEKSEGQLLELGIAYSLSKNILICVNKKVKENYYLIYGIGQIIEFKDLQDLSHKLPNVLNIHNRKNLK